MKPTILMIALMMLLSAAALGQIPQINQAGLGSQFSQFNASMPSVTSGGAPTPITPSSAESLNLQIPSVSASPETPSAQERTQTLINSSQEAAYAYAPDSASMGGAQTARSGISGGSGLAGGAATTSGLARTGWTESSGATGTTATAKSTCSAMYSSTSFSKVITPQGTYAPNNLYISYAPQTVASCNLYANLPLWMNTAGQGSIWFYEWYPSGMLDTNYAGFVYYPGWYKRWFFADTPGWHIMQFYCAGWSNYAYVYVYGPSGYWVNPYPEYDPTPYPYPYWDSEITYTYPPTGQVYYTYGSNTVYGA